MSKRLDSSTIGIRAQEIHEGLRDVTAFGPKEAHLQPTLLIGKAASLATHLKGLDYVDNYEALTYLAAELGITGSDLPHVLRELEEVDFATVINQGSSRIKRVELRVPELRDGYTDLGRRWQELEPGEIEQAVITTLDDVAAMPRHEEEMRQQLGLDAPTFDTVLAIGTTGAVMARHNPGDEPAVIYSPLTVEEKPDALLVLASRFPEDRIIRALSEVREQQGVPVEHLVTSAPEIIREAVLLGILCPVRISTGAGERTFLFTPQGGLLQEERVILEKARALLACVRYGQHYADVRKILYPRRILETLRSNKTFAYPRPDVPEQYGLLVRQQIGRIEEDRFRPGFYHFQLIDTPENVRALDIAIDLLELGQAPRSRLEVDPSQFIGVAGAFAGTLPTRTKMSRGVRLTQESGRNILATLSKLTRGVL